MVMTVTLSALHTALLALGEATEAVYGTNESGQPLAARLSDRLAELRTVRRGLANIRSDLRGDPR